MSDLVVSCDLGQVGDFTATAVLRRSPVLGPEGHPVLDFRCRPVYRHAVVHLERFPLGTGYPAVVSATAALVRSPELKPAPRLVLDATGVGRAVCELFVNELRLDGGVVPLTITAGDAAREDSWAPGVRGWWVPKVELVSAVQAALGTHRLKVARGLKEGETLRPSNRTPRTGHLHRS